MVVAAADFPDKAATDAAPTAVPLGPQADKVIKTIQENLRSIGEIKRTICQQARPRHRGPLEIVLLTTEKEDRAQVRQQARSNLDTVIPGGFSGSVSTSMHGRGEAVPVDEPVAGSLLVWRHPMATFAHAVLPRSRGIFDWSLYWGASPAQLPMEPGSGDWPALPPLYISVSGADDQVNSIIEDLKATCISNIGRRQITEFTRYDSVKSLRNNAEVTEDPYLPEGPTWKHLEVGFKSRTTTHSASGIYNLSASELDAALADAITSPGPTGLDRSETPEEPIQLTITSPPYLDAIDYDAFASEFDEDWSGTSSEFTPQTLDEKLEAWKATQRAIFSRLYDLTREGGYCAVVIGHVKAAEGEWAALPHELAPVLREIGWTFHERVVWAKTTDRSNRFGTTIQNPSATYYYPNQQHEEVMIWRKGDIQHRQSMESLEMSELMKQEVANNVWHIPPVPHNKPIDHPCPFPEELVHRLTVLYSHPGDIVVDPMAGSGTTVNVATSLNRIGIGTELKPEFVTEARDRLSNSTYTRNDTRIPAYEQLEGDSEEAQLTTHEAVDESGTDDAEQARCSPPSEAHSESEPGSETSERTGEQAGLMEYR